MLTRITIHVDENGKEVIKIEQRKTDDVRDVLVQRFLERLQNSSNLCSIQCVADVNTEHEKKKVYHITTLSPDDLKNMGVTPK